VKSFGEFLGLIDSLMSVPEDGTSPYPERAEGFLSSLVEPLLLKRYHEIMKIGPGLTFSWKRALGITQVKRKISKATGIPLTRSGRQRKLGKWLGMR